MWGVQYKLSSSLNHFLNIRPTLKGNIPFACTVRWKLSQFWEFLGRRSCVSFSANYTHPFLIGNDWGIGTPSSVLNVIGSLLEDLLPPCLGYHPWGIAARYIPSRHYLLVFEFPHVSSPPMTTVFITKPQLMNSRQQVWVLYVSKYRVRHWYHLIRFWWLVCFLQQLIQQRGGFVK